MPSPSSMHDSPISKLILMAPPRWYRCVMTPPISVLAIPQKFIVDVANAYVNVCLLYVLATSAAYTMMGIPTSTPNMGAMNVYTNIAHIPQCGAVSSTVNSVNDASVLSVSPQVILILRGMCKNASKYAVCASTLPAPPTMLR